MICTNKTCNIRKRVYTEVLTIIGEYNIYVGNLSNGEEIIGTQTINDKITSDETKIVVGIRKGTKTYY